MVTERHGRPWLMFPKKRELRVGRVNDEKTPAKVSHRTPKGVFSRKTGCLSIVVVLSLTVYRCSAVQKWLTCLHVFFVREGNERRSAGRLVLKGGPSPGEARSTGRKARGERILDVFK